MPKTLPPDELDAREQAILQEIEDRKRILSEIRASKVKAQKAKRTRMAMLVGDLMLANMDRDPKLRESIVKQLAPTLSNTADRALFDLEPLAPKSAPPAS